MEAYRDQYATLFNNGRNVAVIAISVDPDTMQASWAHEEDFPVIFASDTSGAVGKLYNARAERFGTDDRSLFVVGPDGRITYVTRPFNVVSQKAYTELAKAVDAASGNTAADSTATGSGG
ncbi:MAG TPA: redoxin domain-containing protein [Gemmatimonadaceae bacterium]|nr:redoxin domain-containing protein [Gemmatimonadaceae bacterium]